MIKTGKKDAPTLAALLIFLIATPVIFGPYGQSNGYTPDLHMAAYIQVGAMIVLSLFVLSAFSRKRITVPRSPLLLPVLLFYAWAMLSVLWALAKYEAVVDALDWTGAFLCAMLVVLILRNFRATWVLMVCLLISGLLMALLGIGQYLFGVDWVHQHIVPAATFSNKNMAGQYGLLTLPLAVMFFLCARSKLQVWLLAAVIALIMTFIFYTRSRGVWVSFAVEALVLAGALLYLKRRHGDRLLSDLPVKKVALAAAAALFVGLAYLTPEMLGNTDKVMDASIGVKPAVLAAEHGGEVLKDVAEDFTGSAGTRVTIWGNSVGMFLDHFLVGVGLGNWTTYYATYQSWFRPDSQLMAEFYHTNAHNDYVEILCELGIVGFALFAWVMVSLFRVIGRLLSNRGGEHFLLTASLTAAIVGVAVNAVFSFPLKQPVPIFMVLVYLAVLSNLYGALVEKGRDFTLTMPPVLVRAVIAGGVILATTGLLVTQYNWHHSQVDYRTAVASLKMGRYDQAYQAASRAYALNPLRSNLLWYKAIAMVQARGSNSYAKAIEMLEESERTRPYSFSVLWNLANIYNAAGRSEDAVAALSRLVEVQPTSSRVRYARGSRLMKMGRLEEALGDFEGVVLPFREFRLGKTEERLRWEEGDPVPEILSVRRRELANMKKLIRKIRLDLERKKEAVRVDSEASSNPE